VRALNHGRDARNTTLVYRLMPIGVYFVVSAGPNRRFEVRDAMEYANRTPPDKGDDIVFRNGKQITKAGKQTAAIIGSRRHGIVFVCDQDYL